MYQKRFAQKKKKKNVRVQISIVSITVYMRIQYHDYFIHNVYPDTIIMHHKSISEKTHIRTLIFKFSLYSV